MIKYENDCIGCAAPGYPCRGESCEYRHVPHFYCDKCGYEAEKLYWHQGSQLCDECLIEAHEVVLEDD